MFQKRTFAAFNYMEKAYNIVESKWLWNVKSEWLVEVVNDR